MSLRIGRVRPRRGETFVTRKITIAATRIKEGLQETLVLGNMDAKRDWGYAPEYVEGMWRILQQDRPDDFVLATGKTCTVREFVELAFSRLGMTIEWRGNAENERGICKETGKTVVAVSPEFYRPTEVDLLIGNPAKAEKILGWKAKTNLEKLVEIMVDNDLKRARAEAAAQRL